MPAPAIRTRRGLFSAGMAITKYCLRSAPRCVLVLQAALEVVRYSHRRSGATSVSGEWGIYFIYVYRSRKGGGACRCLLTLKLNAI